MKRSSDAVYGEAMEICYESLHDASQILVFAPLRVWQYREFRLQYAGGEFSCCRLRRQTRLSEPSVYASKGVRQILIFLARTILVKIYDVKSDLNLRAKSQQHRSDDDLHAEFLGMMLSLLLFLLLRSGGCRCRAEAT